MGVVLREYQRTAQTKIKGAWDAGARCAMFTLATGLGKTATVSNLISAHCQDGRGIVQAHRSELVGQLSLALAKEGVEHDITASPPVRRQIIDNHLEKIGRSYYRPDGDWSVESVDTALRRDPKKGIKYVFQDEGHHCFPAGTQVDGVPIEQLKIGDMVTAFDEKTGVFALKAVTHIFKHIAPKSMVRIQAAHHVLESTLSHPIWTQRGWVDAGEITNADYVYMVPNTIHTNEIQHQTQVGKNRCCVLREQQVRLCTQNCKLETSCGSCTSEVQHLRESLPSYRMETCALEGERNRVLQQDMFRRIQTQSFVGDNEQNQQTSRFCADDRQQPNAQRCKPFENDCCNGGARAENTRGQWGTSNTSGSCASCDVCTNGVCNAACCKNWPKSAKSLQDRLCTSNIQDSDRSGWCQPQQHSAQSFGRPQGCISNWVQVESATVYESGDSGQSFDGYVYNIEVADFHTYTANGIAVHNCLAENKWGRSLLRYPDAKWCLPTATAGRADGKGLGRHTDGLVDVLLEGPNLAWGMDNGFLVEYDILHPTASDLDLGGISVGASGEFNQSEVAKRVKKSNKIVGDAVQHYLDHAAGRLCIVFAVDIEHAETLLQAYLAKGVPTELVTGNDLDSARLGALKRFEQRQTLVLINVDLFGEGTDVPGVEVVQMCRPTASFPLFVQQVGRMLRLDISQYLQSIWDTLSPQERKFQISISRKPKALLIDHVGNIHREFKICDVTYSGPPEGFNAWSIERRGKRSSGAGGAIPLRMCSGCFQPYERFYDCCPYCGTMAPEPAARGTPEQVDGALQFYDPAILAKMRADIARIDGEPLLPKSLAGHAEIGARKHWQERQAAQHHLRNTIAAWAGKHHNVADSVNYKRFYMLFGIDVVSAATLGTTEANALRAKIEKELQV